jgi:hypothetical protein
MVSYDGGSRTNGAVAMPTKSSDVGRTMNLFKQEKQIPPHLHEPNRITPMPMLKSSGSTPDRATSVKSTFSSWQKNKLKRTTRQQPTP